MLRSGLLLLALVPALGAPLQGQSAVADASPSQVRTRPVPQLLPPRPFSIDELHKGSGLSIEFLPTGQMTTADRTLAADAESSIAEHARLSGYDLQRGQWSYQQILCPALPGHLFLQYLSNNGAKDFSVFSASIPRAGAGRVRIIPILKRSYSLFSPAPVNALTISAFNHIRAEQPSGDSADWLGNGLCYAALAGAHPRIASPDAALAREEPTPMLSAMMEIPLHGGEIIRFVDGAALPRPMEWTMTFTPKGKLIKATHMRAPLIKPKPVPPSTAPLKTHPVPAVVRN